VNENNPLGTGGHLAKEYDAVIKELWFGSNAVVTPTNLKLAIARFAPQFSGYDQHDSQEVMSYLLHGLHEDLNRVQHKPYVEMPDGSCGRADELVAAEAWEKFSARDRSAVVEQFYGQFKVISR
ncbi:unnamed protein product, partial [Chrysoparadoxa australica]